MAADSEMSRANLQPSAIIWEITNYNLFYTRREAQGKANQIRIHIAAYRTRNPDTTSNAPVHLQTTDLVDSVTLSHVAQYTRLFPVSCVAGIHKAQYIRPFPRAPHDHRQTYREKFPRLNRHSFAEWLNLTVVLPAHKPKNTSPNV